MNGTLVFQTGMLLLGLVVFLAFVALIVILGFYVGLVVFQLAAIGLAIMAVFFYFGGLYFLIFDFSGTMESISNHPEDIWIVAYTIVVTIVLLVLGYRYNRNRQRAITEETFTFKYQSQDQEDDYQEEEQESFFSSDDELRLRDLELLGLERTSSEDEIKKAYRSLSKKYHPDLNSDPHATIIFKQIQKAYDNLMTHSH